MKLVDANVLLYAVNIDARHHERVRSWLDGALSGSETVAFAWIGGRASSDSSPKSGCSRRR